MSQFWKVVDSETRPFLSRKYFGPSPKKKEEEKQNGIFLTRKNYRFPPKKERKKNSGFLSGKKIFVGLQRKIIFCSILSVVVVPLSALVKKYRVSRMRDFHQLGPLGPFLHNFMVAADSVVVLFELNVQWN